MQRQDFLLPAQSPGSQRSLSSWHFGQTGAQPRIYIQAGLHADEIPGLLVAQQLLQKLHALELAGQILGEIVLVPVANPIGLNQSSMGRNQGRFDSFSGQNFNRGFPDLVESASQKLQKVSSLDGDAQHIKKHVRAVLKESLNEVPALTEFDTLQKTLFSLALEADVVLDLHCDGEAAMHVYAHSEQLETARALAGYLGAKALLHAYEQGGQSFDDACTRQWWNLKQQFAEFPIPLGCFAATIELRGQADVDQDLANVDAEALLNFLRWCGAVAGEFNEPPSLPFEPTPLRCTDALITPVSGVIVYRGDVGRWVQAGEALVDIVDPLSGNLHTLHAREPGMYYARVVHRFAQPGMELCYVAGSTQQRSGNLLSA